MSRLKKLWLLLAAILFGLVIMSGTTTWVRDVLEKPLVLNETIRPADVIIVLGSGTTKKGDHLPAQGRARVLGGIISFRRHLAPRLLMAGGLDKNTKLVEADAMAAYAVAQGQPSTTIEEDRQSRDTWENAKNSLAIMKQHQWQTAIVVTSPYHTWRACRMFRKLGGDIRCLAAPFSLVPANSFVDHLRDTRSVVREYGAIVYNWLKGQL